MKIISCPRCSQPLEVAGPFPVTVQCPMCDKTFTVSPPKSSKPKKSAQIKAAAGQSTATMSPPVTRQPTVQQRPAVKPAGNAVLYWLIGGSLAGIVMLALGTIAYMSNVRNGKELGDNGQKVLKQNVQFHAPHETSEHDKAIEKGVAYLKKRMEQEELLYYYGRSGGPHVGAAALAGLTLLECNVPPTDPAVIKAKNVVEAHQDKLTFTYSVALSVLFLDVLSQKTSSKTEKANYRDLIRIYSSQLLASQQPGGGWSYDSPTLNGLERQKLLRDIANKSFQPGDFQTERGTPLYYDNSIAQFATLALWAARKYDIPVTDALLLEERRYRDHQLDDGSWNYRDEIKVSVDNKQLVRHKAGTTQRDATTCAGLIGLAIGRAVLLEGKEKADPKNARKEKFDITKADPQVRKALKFMGGIVGMKDKLTPAQKSNRRNFTTKFDKVQKQVYEAKKEELGSLKQKLDELDEDELATGILFGSDAWGDLYLLWCIERMAVVYDLHQIDGKDWFGWGSQVILKNQQSDGSWRERFPGVPDTCFALLFLKRANVVQDLTDKLRMWRASLENRGPVLRNPVFPQPAFPPSREV